MWSKTTLLSSKNPPAVIVFFSRPSLSLFHDSVAFWRGVFLSDSLDVGGLTSGLLGGIFLSYIEMLVNDKVIVYNLFMAGEVSATAAQLVVPERVAKTFSGFNQDAIGVDRRGVDFKKHLKALGTFWSQKKAPEPDPVDNGWNVDAARTRVRSDQEAPEPTSPGNLPKNPSPDKKAPQESQDPGFQLGSHNDRLRVVYSKDPQLKRAVDAYASRYSDPYEYRDAMDALVAARVGDKPNVYVEADLYDQVRDVGNAVDEQTPQRRASLRPPAFTSDPIAPIPGVSMGEPLTADDAVQVAQANSGESDTSLYQRLASSLASSGPSANSEPTPSAIPGVTVGEPLTADAAVQVAQSRQVNSENDNSAIDRDISRMTEGDPGRPLDGNNLKDKESAAEAFGKHVTMAVINGARNVVINNVENFAQATMLDKALTEELLTISDEERSEGVDLVKGVVTFDGKILVFVIQDRTQEMGTSPDPGHVLNPEGVEKVVRGEKPEASDYKDYKVRDVLADAYLGFMGDKSHYSYEDLISGNIPLQNLQNEVARLESERAQSGAADSRTPSEGEARAGILQTIQDRVDAKLPSEGEARAGILQTIQDRIDARSIPLVPSSVRPVRQEGSDGAGEQPSQQKSETEAVASQPEEAQGQPVRVDVKGLEGAELAGVMSEVAAQIKAGNTRVEISGIGRYNTKRAGEVGAALADQLGLDQEARKQIGKGARLTVDGVLVVELPKQAEQTIAAEERQRLEEQLKALEGVRAEVGDIAQGLEAMAPKTGREVSSDRQEAVVEGGTEPKTSVLDDFDRRTEEIDANLRDLQARDAAIEAPLPPSESLPQKIIEQMNAITGGSPEGAARGDTEPGRRLGDILDVLSDNTKLAFVNDIFDKLESLESEGNTNELKKLASNLRGSGLEKPFGELTELIDDILSEEG